MENKNNKNNHKLLLSIISLSFAFCIGLCSFMPITNVKANSTNFIQENDYTIVLPSFTYNILNTNNNVEDLCYTGQTMYLGFNVETGTVQFSFPTLVNTDMVAYVTQNFNKNTTTKYVLDGEQYILFYSPQVYDKTINLGYNAPYDLLPVSEITFFNKSSNFETFFESYYRYVGYTYSNTKVVTMFYDANNVVIGEIYYTLDLGRNVTTYSKNFSGISTKIDRSDYVSVIRETEKIYIDEVDDFKSLYTTIRSGISNLLGTKIFGDFTLGHTFAIMISLVGFTFLFHIIVK